MTTASRANEGEIGIALQSAEGTLAANPTFAQPLYSGLPKPAETFNEIDVTDTSGLLVPGHFKTEQHWEMDLNIPVLPIGIGAYINAILPALSTSGTANPYTHTFTPTAGTATPPFVTMFARNPGTAYRKFGDGTVSELTFNFTHGDMLKANVKAMGYTPYDLAAAYTAGTTEAVDSDGSYYTMIGGTFKLDHASTPASTTVATVSSGALSIAREVRLIQTDGFTPEHRDLGRFRVAASLDLLYANYELYKATFFGSTSGTASSQTVVYGSLDFTFAVGPSTSANTTLQVQVPNIALRVTDPPDVDPGAGGPVMLSVAGVTAKPASGEIVTAILKSSASDY